VHQHRDERTRVRLELLDLVAHIDDEPLRVDVVGGTAIVRGTADDSYSHFQFPLMFLRCVRVRVVRLRASASLASPWQDGEVVGF
jgi:hypothetical protein